MKSENILIAKVEQESMLNAEIAQKANYFKFCKMSFLLQQETMLNDEIVQESNSLTFFKNLCESHQFIQA